MHRSLRCASDGPPEITGGPPPFPMEAEIRSLTASRALTPLVALWICVGACRIEGPPTAGRAVAPVDTAEGEIPIRLVGPNDAALVVPVHINGAGPYDFVFDTGATLTCVDPVLVEQLGLEELPLAPGFGIGAGGAERLEVVAIDSMRIAMAGVSDLMACVLDLSQARRFGVDVHGLVGLNFIKPFRVTIDLTNGLLRIVQPQPASAADASDGAGR